MIQPLEYRAWTQVDYRTWTQVGYIAWTQGVRDWTQVVSQAWTRLLLGPGHMVVSEPVGMVVLQNTNYIIIILLVLNNILYVSFLIQPLEYSAWTQVVYRAWTQGDYRAWTQVDDSAWTQGIS